MNLDHTISNDVIDIYVMCIDINFIIYHIK